MADSAYPLEVQLPGGRVRHAAKHSPIPGIVHTLCHKRGRPVGDGAGLSYCAACQARPNPISQQTRR